MWQHGQRSAQTGEIAGTRRTQCDTAENPLHIADLFQQFAAAFKGIIFQQGRYRILPGVQFAQVA